MGCVSTVCFAHASYSSLICVPLCSFVFQAKKVGGKNPSLGIDGVKGVIADMSGVWDPYAVKVQTIKTAVEVGAWPWLWAVVFLCCWRVWSVCSRVCVHSRLPACCCALMRLCLDCPRRNSASRKHEWWQHVLQTKHTNNCKKQQNKRKTRVMLHSSLLCVISTPPPFLSGTAASSAGGSDHRHRWLLS